MPSTITAEKAAFRKVVKDFPLTKDEKARSDALLLQRFLALPRLEECSSLLLYYGVGQEPDTSPLLDRLFTRGKTLFLPRCLPGGQMEACRYRGTEHLVLNSFGIPEPDGDCPVVSRKEPLSWSPAYALTRTGFAWAMAEGTMTVIFPDLTASPLLFAGIRFYFPSFPEKPMTGR